MTIRRAGVALGLLLMLVAAAVFGWSVRSDPLGPRAPAERPTLLLLTSLPLVFGESFSLGGGGSPTLTRLRQRYRVQPIAIADAASLRHERLLLMAHPRAQTADALDDLDRWVRGGGRLLLLADPMLEWPSIRPLGDPLRPPPGFADTGLLAHWGLRLIPPVQRGTVDEQVGGRRVRFGSPGTLAASRFAVAAHGRIARGAVGKGRVTVVADADWLADEQSLGVLVAELARLER
ncbi:MAG: DUF4350 domain-containing protein [Sphingomicrobium sp.]